MRTAEPARAEIALADGNVLHVGGGTRLKFASLYAQQGSDDEVSAIELSEGSVIISSVGSSDEGSVPRVDTQEASIYANAGARARVNADQRRGTSVVVRAGSVEVKTPSGSYTVRAGNYLLAEGDSEPEIARGSFSRDRFDLWAADRLEVTYDSPRNASSEYVDDDYEDDVQSLDGYGNWEYNSTYSTNVWRPTVAVGWSPYSNGSWYYTNVGLSWWSWDPWGWYPHHYGNWFYDTGWSSWCWSPGYVYSPAWVHWGYSGSYVGWCPTGWYGGYSPWVNSYHKNWSYPRDSVAFAINGRYNTRNVDLRGWNFTGASNVGVTRGRMPVTAGTRVVDRLGSDLSVSSRPIVLADRGRGGVQEGLRNHISEAPRVIERTSGRDSQRLAPVLARQSTLPRDTVNALRDRAVVTERRGLSGPGARDLAPSGAAVVERGSGSVRIERSERGNTGRTVITDRNAPSDQRRAPADTGRTARPAPQDNGRGGSTQATREGREVQPRETSRPPAGDTGRRSAPSASPRDGAGSRPVLLVGAEILSALRVLRPPERAALQRAGRRLAVPAASPGPTGHRGSRAGPPSASRAHPPTLLAIASATGRRGTHRLAAMAVRLRSATTRRGNGPSAAPRASTPRGTLRLATRLPGSTPPGRPPAPASGRLRRRARRHRRRLRARLLRRRVRRPRRAAPPPPPRDRDGPPAVPDVSRGFLLSHRAFGRGLFLGSEIMRG